MPDRGRAEPGAEPETLAAAAAVPAPLAALARRPAVRRFLDAVLDKRDRKGRFPKTYTVASADQEMAELDRFLPPAIVRRKSGGRFVVQLKTWEEILAAEAVDHGQPPTQLEAVFDWLTRRAPRNLLRDRAAWRSALVGRILAGVDEGKRRAGRGDDPALEKLVEAWVENADRGRSSWFALSRGAGLDRIRELVARVVAGFLIARVARSEILFIDQLSMRAAGDTKALRPGTEDHRRLTEALLAAEPEIASELKGHAAHSRPVRNRLYLDHLGIASPDLPGEVLVLGDLSLRMDGKNLGDVGHLADSGLAAKLTYATLRRAERVTTAAGTVLTVENLTAFHLLAARLDDTLLVFTGGQAGWTVVKLLQRLAEGAARRPDDRLRFEHTGDLDRSALLILRSLRERTALPIEPRWMSALVFDACMDKSLDMTAEERSRVLDLQRRWDEPFGVDLLARLADTGRWIEQEQVVERSTP